MSREKIIINFPSNLGDVIICLLVLDRIRAHYPQGYIAAIASPKTREFLLRNSFIDDVIIFDKLWSFKQKMRFSFSLRGKYDTIVDLKNSFLPVVLGTKRRTPFCRKNLKGVHAKEVYLKVIDNLVPKKQSIRGDFILDDEEKRKWQSLQPGPFLFIACTSNSKLKFYPYDYLKKLVEVLKEDYPLVILGENKDRLFYKDILDMEGVVDLVGKTTMGDVHYLLKNYARLLLCVDSCIMHLGSYLNLPTVALFGATDPDRYGPWSDKATVLVNKSVACVPCLKAVCSFNRECMQIPSQNVKEAIASVWQT